MFQKLFLFVSVFVFAVTAYSQQTFMANASGLQVVPPTDSSARAQCKLLIGEQFGQALCECDYTGITDISLANIHGPAGIGSNAPALLLFPPVGFKGSGSFMVVINGITPQTFADLRANKLYINFTSEAFPNGFMRGQFYLRNGTYNDFDGDGRTDLTVYRNSNNTFYTQQSLGNIFRSQQIGQTGDSVSLTLDFDGDGRSDFSTARYNAEVLWRIFKSKTETLEETRWGSSALGDIFAAADYDDDGKADIAVFRAGTWYIIGSASGLVSYKYFGQSGDIPAPNDFDKDGRVDLAVARSENGQRVWYIRRSSDEQFYSLPWGLSSDAFFTGRTDWDGDGAADITVIRNESGQRVFYIHRSSDNQLQIIRWGLSSDVVKLGDYDGDGKTDAAVTRAVSGQRVFYILQSSNGAIRYETFGLAGDF